MAKHIKVTHGSKGTYYVNLEEAHWAPREGPGADIHFNGQTLAIVETCEWLMEQLYGTCTPKSTPEAPCTQEAPTARQTNKAKRVRVAK